MRRIIATLVLVALSVAMATPAEARRRVQTDAERTQSAMGEQDFKEYKVPGGSIWLPKGTPTPPPPPTTPTPATGPSSWEKAGKVVDWVLRIVGGVKAGADLYQMTKDKDQGDSSVRVCEACTPPPVETCEACHPPASDSQTDVKAAEQTPPAHSGGGGRAMML